MRVSEKIDQYIADWPIGAGRCWPSYASWFSKPILDITEEWKWNSPVWSHGKPVCSASAFKTHVGMNFFQGAFLDDPQGAF
jgi:hypothetical protein